VNGAGKSTFLAAISGLLRPRSGSIAFDGSPIEGIRSDRIARLGVTLVPEGRDLFRDMTVAENLAMGAYRHKAGAKLRDDLARIYDYFPRLHSRQRQAADTLSGGEQQMLAIGRALMSRPRLLLVDEPSLGLAPLMVETIFEVLERVNRTEQITMLVVEQNTRIALAISHVGYVLETGRVVLSGPSKDLLQQDLIRKSYLGG
jgi:branched-chain amino acid transport system ATP-binding protein